MDKMDKYKANKCKEHGLCTSWLDTVALPVQR